MAAPMKATFAMRRFCNNLCKTATSSHMYNKLQYRQMGFLGDRFLGDLKWKGKKGKKDEVVTAEVVDKSVREPALDSADMVVGETAPVKKRQCIETVRGYKPPGDVVEQLQALTEQIYGDLRDWRKQSLQDRFKKYKLLTKAMKEFDHDIPNFDLHLMSTVDDVVKYFQTEVRDGTKLEDLSKLDLPKNLHMNLEPIRFDPDTDTVYGGKTAFPGQKTIVPSIKYRRKYKGYEGKIRWK